MNEQRLTGEGQAPETGTPAVEPHATSMAVWDVPSPTVLDSKMPIKIGVSCPEGCSLAGAEVEIYDHMGTKVASGSLGDTPWPGSGSLYWTEIEPKAPGAEEYFNWTARFPEQGLEVLHEEASHPFGFRTVKQPEITVTIEVTDRDTNTPIADANVFLHPYRGLSDERGVLMLMVPRGEYELQVLANDKQPFLTSISVSDDTVVKVELLDVPPRRETYP